MIHLEELFQISNILQRGLDPEATYEAVFDLLERTVLFTSATLFLYKEAEDQLEMVLKKGDTVVDLVSDVHFSRGRGLSSYISKQRRPVVIEELPAGAGSKNKPFRSFVSLPLWVDNKLVGVLNLGHKDPHIYTQDQIDAYEKISGQISVVMDKLNLRAELKEKNDQLEKALKELQQTQQKLIDKERLAAIGEVVVTVNHKINNPLTIIITNAEMLPLQLEMNRSEQAVKAAQRIVRAAFEIKKITHKLGNISDPQKEQYLDDVSMISLD